MGISDLLKFCRLGLELTNSSCRSDIQFWTFEAPVTIGNAKMVDQGGEGVERVAGFDYYDFMEFSRGPILFVAWRANCHAIHLHL